jgi:hypothetical protein
MRTDLLKTLATNFGANSALAAKAIREMYVRDPEGFSPAVAELLQDGAELPGASYLMAILVAETDWLRTACDPLKYSLQQSLDLVRRSRKLDPQTEVKLAKMLAALRFVNEEESRFAARVLEVLERSPDPSTALPALRQLAHSENARIRSKAALLIGRIVRNPQWANERPMEDDPRVAANAVESLWGLATPAAREVFFRAALDKYHRTAANGIVGLYRMGDPASIPFLFHLSRSEKPLARAAAAWAMGTLGDPRFLPLLARLMDDPDPGQRKGAFRAMSLVRQRMSELRAAGALRVQIRDCECRGTAHRVRFTVTREERVVNGLDLRHFVAWNGPEVVEEFLSSEHDRPSPYYEIDYHGPPSTTYLVKVQVYAPSGVGEDTGFEMAFP